MIQIAKFSGQKVGVLGLGVAAVESLGISGAEVYVWDDCRDRRFVANKRGFSVVDFGSEGLRDVDFLFVSPGIPLVYPEPHPVIQLARSSGV